MPRGSAIERRAAIVDVARRRLTGLGFDATTIGDIATELGISKAAIAYYFPTKDLFLKEFVDPVLDELEEAIKAAGRDPRAVVSNYLDVLVRHLDLAVWIDTDPAIQRSDTHGDRLSQLNARAIAVITGGSRRKSDRLQALGVLGGIWRPARESTADELAQHRDELVNAALDGYTARPAN